MDIDTTNSETRSWYSRRSCRSLLRNVTEHWVRCEIRRLSRGHGTCDRPSFLNRVSPLVLLALCLASCCPGYATAQDTSERPEGVVCREPECDLRRSLPRNLDLPFEQHAFYVERVQNTPASSLDPALGNVPFDVWLHANLQGYRWAGPGESFASWELTYCDSASSAVSARGGPDLCVEVNVPVVGDRQLQCVVRVGEVDTHSAMPRWRDILPEVHDIYINRLQEHATDRFPRRSFALRNRRAPRGAIRRLADRRSQDDRELDGAGAGHDDRAFHDYGCQRADTATWIALS